MNERDLHTRNILARVEAGEPISQRGLARDLGIALGLTNLLLRQMARKGWVRLRKIQRNRMLYFITPTGVAEKARISRAYLAETLKFYAEARQRIGDGFEALLRDQPAAADSTGRHDKKVVFLGAGELAEIAYICLDGRGLTLCGVIDDERTTPFFGVPVYRLEQLEGTSVGDQPYWRLIVMKFEDPSATQAALAARGVPLERVCWL